MATRKDFPRLFRDLRRDLGLTQAQAARLIKVRPNTVARWENGVIHPGAAMRAHAMNTLRNWEDKDGR